MFNRELTNLTKESGKMVKLICEVQNLDANNTNSRVSFVWKLNEVPVETDNRFKIRNVKVRGAIRYVFLLKVYRFRSKIMCFAQPYG